jgi:hypothetical protein
MYVPASAGEDGIRAAYRDDGHIQLEAGGLYNLTRPLVIDRTNSRLDGQGAWLMNHGTGVALQVGAPGVASGGQRIRNLILAGTGPAAVRVLDVMFARLEDVEVLALSGEVRFHNGIELLRCGGTKLDAKVSNCWHDGIVVTESGDILIAPNTASDGNGRAGFAFRDCGGVYVTSTRAWSNGQSAYRFDSGGLNKFFFMTACIGDWSGAHNWAIHNLVESEITACWGSSQSPGGARDGCGFWFGPEVRDVAVTWPAHKPSGLRILRNTETTRLPAQGQQASNPSRDAPCPILSRLANDMETVLTATVPYVNLGV